MKTPTVRKTSVRRGVAANTQKTAPLRESVQRIGQANVSNCRTFTDHYRLAPSGGDTGTPLVVKQLTAEPTKVKASPPAPAPSSAPDSACVLSLVSAPAPDPSPSPSPVPSPAPLSVTTSTPTSASPGTPATPVVTTSTTTTPVPTATCDATSTPAPHLESAPATAAERRFPDVPDAPQQPQQQQQQQQQIQQQQQPKVEEEVAVILLAPQIESVPAAFSPKKYDVCASTLQHRLKNLAVGFDALAVVLQHTLKRVEILKENERPADYNVIKHEWKNNKLLIGETKEKICGLESSLAEKINNIKHISLANEKLTKKSEDLILEKEKLKQDTSTIISTLEKKCQIQEELISQYEEEKAELLALHTEKICEFSEKEQKVRQDYEASIAQLQQDFLQHEDIKKTEISQLRDDHERVKKQLATLQEADIKDGRLQVSLTRCAELEEEVRSLQSVLELRHQELQELRKNNGSLTRQADQLPSALQRVTALEARVEDLQAQLKEKGEFERQAAQQHCALVEALQKEVNQNKRLTLLTEELQWKLKQNSEVFSAFVAMNGTSANIQEPSTSGTSSPAVSRKNTNGSLHSISESGSSPKAMCETLSRLSVSLMKRVNSSSHQPLRPDMSEEISSPPSSPKIKGIVEKTDSVSWVLDMEESSEELVARLVRRAGSFRGTTPPPSSSSPHSQTLPTTKRRYKSGSLSLSSSSSAVFRRSNSKNDNTVSCAEQDQDHNEQFGSARSRSHSVSADSVDSVNIINWGLNISDSFNKTPENNHEMCTQDNKILISVKSAGSKTFIPHTIHNEMDLVLTNSFSSELQKHANENGKQNWNCNMPDFSNDESPTKSSGSSAYTSSDEDVRNNTDGKNIVSDENYCHSETSSHLPNVHPFNALNICGSPNTADLSLLAACAAAQPALMPKDAAGEAMISEETSEDENDQDEVDDHDETVSSSITRSASENEDEEEDDDHFMNI